MKKLFILTILLGSLLSGYAQVPVQFLINGKVGTSADCETLDNLKVKFKVPSTVKNYDGTTCEVLLSNVDVGFYIWEPEDYYSGGYFSADILKNGKKAGDFVYADTPIKIRDLCKNIGGYQTLDVEFKAYHKTGMETYWDDYSESWKTRPTWDNGKMLAKGQMKIKQFDKPTGFASDDGKVSGAYADPNSGLFWYDTDDFSILYRTDDYEFRLRGIPIRKSYIESKDLYKTEKENNPDLTPYEFLKMDIMAWVGSRNQNVNFENNNNYIDECAIDWASSDYLNVFYNYCNPDFDVTELDEDHKKGFKSMFADWQPKYFNKPELWSKEKIGDYEYDHLHVDNFYPVKNYKYDSSKRQWVKELADKPGVMDVYLLDLGDYVMVLAAVWNNTYDYHLSFVPYDVSLQKEFIEKTLQSIKFNYQ